MNAPLPTLPGTQTLDHLAAGSRVQVLAVGGDLAVRRRLLEMGVCPGITLDVIRRAPLGDPLEVRVRGYLLSLRLDQAGHISVAPLAPASAAVA